MKNIKKGFTLIEIMVALTIFSIIMTSVITVYLTTSQATYDSEINRALQENVKNILTTISEDVYMNGIDSVEHDGKILKTGKNTYQFKNGDYVVNNIEDCKKEDSLCYLAKGNDKLTNNLVNISNIKFRVTGEDKEVKKVTITMRIQPSLQSGVLSSKIESNTVDFQITLSERNYKTND